MKWIAGKMIKFYKLYLSQLLDPQCIYIPTCSSYTYQAIAKYGVIRGIAKGTVRIAKCNPFAKGGFAPVKENYKGKAKWLL